MGIGIWKLVLIIVIVFIIFGAGKLPKVMGDLGRGIRSLKEGLKGEPDEDEKPKQEFVKEIPPHATVIDAENDNARR